MNRRDIHPKLMVLLIVPCLLMSCMASNAEPTPVEIRCDDFSLPYSAALFDTLRPERAVAWITEQFQISASDVSGGKRDNVTGVTSFHWKRDGRVTTLRFHDDQLVALEIIWQVPGPTGSKLVECLGPPQYYYASREISQHNGYYIELFLMYPERGISATGDASSEEPVNAEETYFTYFFYTQPGMSEVEDMLKPWPGLWEDMEVKDSFPMTPLP